MKAPYPEIGVESRLTVLWQVIGFLLPKHWLFWASQKLFALYWLRSYSPLLSIAFRCVTAWSCVGHVSSSATTILYRALIVPLTRSFLLFGVNDGFECTNCSGSKVRHCDEDPSLLLSWFLCSKIAARNLIEPRIAILKKTAFGTDRTALSVFCSNPLSSCRDLDEIVMQGA